MADKDLYLQQFNASGNLVESVYTPAANGFLAFDGSKDPVAGDFGAFAFNLIPAGTRDLGSVACKWANAHVTNVCAYNVVCTEGDVHAVGNICADMTLTAGANVVGIGGVFSGAVSGLSAAFTNIMSAGTACVTGTVHGSCACFANGARVGGTLYGCTGDFGGYVSAGGGFNACGNTGVTCCIPSTSYLCVSGGIIFCAV